MDFVHFVEDACHEHGLTLWQITPDDVLDSITSLNSGDRKFKTFLDRGQGDPRFDPIRAWARDHAMKRINPLEVSKWSEDKATMHLELINCGLFAPYTILLSPFIEQPILPQLDLTPLGESFVIKPSNGGGGEGVILGASSMDDISVARMTFPKQKYLIQAHITPRVFGEKPAWFRVFYANGETYPCWWNPETHIYAVVSKQEEDQFGLGRLREITLRIASICKLDWFSTEIALTAKFIVVDYVNDEIDTRIQSHAVDGVPDEIMKNVAKQLVKIAREHG